jgi:hypothetical protein
VTLAANGTGATVVTVKTTAATSAAVSRLSLWELGAGGALLACGFILAVPSRRRWPISVLLLFVIAAALIGCGGGGKNSTPAPSVPATTAGNYTCQLVGTDSANAKLTTQTQFTVTVQ